VQTAGFDHPEQTAWRTGTGVIGFRTATHGDSDSVELILSELSPARIEVSADIHGYTKIGDPLKPPPHIHAPSVRFAATGRELISSGKIEHELAGVELRIALERVTDASLPRDVGGEIRLSELSLEPGREHPLFLTARQRDQARIWTSPLFLTLTT
jgi:hypothetical protein